MLPHYRLELTCDAADQVIYEESANYSDAFTLLAVGTVLLSIALLGARFGVDGPSLRKLLATSFSTGFLFCCTSLPCFIRSKIILDRARQTLTIRRTLIRISWTHQYRIEDIERIYEGEGRELKQRALGLELTNGRTKKLNLWAKLTTVSNQETHLNDVLDRFRKFAGRVHKPMTEDEWWDRTKKNASADLKRGLRRSLYFLIAFVATAMAIVPFLYGHSFHQYWKSVGVFLLCASLGLSIALLLQMAFVCIKRSFVKELNKIDREFGTPKE
jgi:hypothetical protein